MQKNNQFKTYFKKLNINPSVSSLELVAELQQKHISTFSFNSIAVLLGQSISLDIEDIYEKIVLKNDGGYCFEHNKLMYEVLNSLGFDVSISIAKVLNNREDIDSPRTHRITILKWESNNYVVDVGFGAFSPKAPMKLDGLEVNGQDYQIVKRQEEYYLEHLKSRSVFHLYKFNLATYTEADCKMGNFYSSHSPDAVFVNNFVVSLIFPERTLSLRNMSYFKIGKNKTEQISIESSTHLREILLDDFNMSFREEEFNVLFEVGRKFEKK
jgi:N-hydroxyarylamine O-acetyltransferase